MSTRTCTASHVAGETRPHEPPSQAGYNLRFSSIIAWFRTNVARRA